MIKFKIELDNGKVAIGFALSAKNIELLKEKKPIKVDLNEMGLNADILIMYGETEEAIIEELKPFIGKDTTIKEYHWKE